MLSSAEEAYTDYLEHVVAEAGVDPVVVRATLRQLGYDDATIAVIMGEASAAVLSSFSSSSSTSADVLSRAISSTQSSAKKQQTSTASAAAAAAASESPTPSEMSRPPPHDVVEGPGHGRRSAFASPLDKHFVQPPSIMRESKPTSHIPTSSSSSSAAASKGSNSSFNEESVPLKCLETEGLNKVSATIEFHTSKASPPFSASIPTTALAKLIATDTTWFPDSQGRYSESGGVDFDANTTSSTDYTAAEQDILSRWMHEYKALLLSSAVPRRAPTSHFGTPAKKLPLEGPFDECLSVLHTEDSDVRSADEGGADHKKLSWDRDESGLPLRPVHCSHHQHDRGLRDNSGLSASTASSSGGYSGDVNSSFSSPDSGNAGVSYRSSAALTRHPNFLGTYRISEKGCWRRQAAFQSKNEPPTPFRHVVPKAKSVLFVPTCDGSRLRCGAVNACCIVTESDCRHPYREAQDVRIVRASRNLAGEVGCRVKLSDGVSQSRARELDQARQKQRTSRAEPTTGHRIPVMQTPVQPAVQPRSGLATGRQTTVTTLPPSARTDRVSLANSYRQAWEKRERRTTAASREAAWDTRYALLSCTVRQLKA